MGGKGTKLYVYVDESGQDTEGELFVVGVVVTGAERQTLRYELEAVEVASRKGKVKWHLSSASARHDYIRAICRLRSLQRHLFIHSAHNTRLYEQETAAAIINALSMLGTRNARSSLYVDGLPKSHVHRFAAMVRSRGMRIEKVRGIRKEENEPLIRLADAICGLQRDALQNRGLARALLRTLQHALSLP